MPTHRKSDAVGTGNTPFPDDELVRHLVARGSLDDLSVQRARRAREKSLDRLDLVLTRLGLVPEPVMAEALAAVLALPHAGPTDFASAPVLPGPLRLAFLRANTIVPIADDGSTVTVAMADPLNTAAVTSLAYLLKRPVVRAVATSAAIEAAIERLYGETATTGDTPAGASAFSGEAIEDDIERLQDIASEAPVIRLVHQLILRAVETRASDIHIEPAEDSLKVRLRIDGVLHTVETLPLTMRAAVTSRVKIMSRLDIAERRLPQDGRMKSVVRGRDVDLRVSTMPTLHGESVVLRILDRSSVRLDFDALGFEPQTVSAFSRVLAEPNGIVLVTGPTGSGKTTTLYTALGRLNHATSKICTVEDPVEYQFDGINQIQVQPKIGLTFATALRSILRQDPDVVMIGEIRDLETAEIAVQASLTGHLVLSTVHTNSAAATISRLLDMGVEDYLLGSSLSAVMAQRLVRQLCRACATPAETPHLLIERLLPGSQVDPSTVHIMRPVGCEACRNTGFTGRLAIAELLPVTTDVRELILSRKSGRIIEQAAVAAGMTTLYRDGLAKAFRGLTTIDEVLRATRVS
jgi:general secretion pathway protein E